MAILKTLLFTVVCVGLAWSCVPPDCNREDCGTCGNACCQIDFFFKSSTLDCYNTMVTNFKKGGADGRYTFKGGQDLRPFNTTADFVLQAWHSTLKNHYNDTLDFNIIPSSPAFTTVTAFSISQIAGAYCDAGQNFKNLVGFFKGIGMPYQAVVTRGCPPMSK